MAKMINKLKAILRNASKRGSKVIFVTARADMDDKKLFIDTFKAQGIDMSKVYVERAGNLGTDTGKMKAKVFRKYLDTGDFKRIRLFDDSMENLYALLDLKGEYPDIDFEAYRVNKTISKKELFEELNKPNTRPKIKQKIRNELVRRGVKITWHTTKNTSI